MVESPMALRFEHDAITRWAAFSGDYNPIHFDPAAARCIGAEDVVVHGMLPVLLAQEAAYRGMMGGASWLGCQVRMKRPLLRGQAASLTLMPTVAGLRLALISGTPAVAHLAGSLTRGGEGLPDAPAARRASLSLQLGPLSLDEGLLRARVAALLELLPQVESAWVQLSAVLFAAFLSHSAAAVQDACRRTLGIAHIGPPGAAVVQTSYAIACDERALGHLSAQGWSACRCLFGPVLTFALHRGCALECRWQVLCGGRRMMDMAVGLLLKTS